MLNHALILSRRPLTLFAFLLGCVFPIGAAADARLSENYGKLPLHFEANQGQAQQDVRFLSRGPGYGLYLTGSEAVLVLSKTPSEEKPDGRSTPARQAAPAQEKSVALRMSLVGATPARAISGIEELPGKSNYFVGSDPEKWRTNVPTYARVHYQEVYPGIDIVYYGNQRQLEYDFIVAPGADPGKIALTFKGARRLEIDAQGDLVLHLTGGVIRQHKPVIYQDIDGVRQEIAGSYVRKGANRYGFKVAAYDRSRPLVIDPVVLAYSTYLGGSADELIAGIAVDSGGNAYVTGTTLSNNFPTTAGAFKASSNTGDVFVAKLNPTASALVYSTYLGGSSDYDYGIRIAVDTGGNAYVTGSTMSTDFPTTPGAFQPNFGGGQYDAFVTKLDPSGSTLAYSTYLGGIGGDHGEGIAVDAAGNAYLTGTTGSLNFPTTEGSFQSTFGSSTEAFVTKLNPAGSSLTYSTYLGGSDSEEGRAIAVDAEGNAYVTGITLSINFPTTVAAFQSVKGGNVDVFVTKLNPAGSALLYSTYLGGNREDIAHAIAVDAGGNAYVAGSTNSSDFPTTAAVFQSTFGGGSSFQGRPHDDVFVTKLNPTGSVLVYSTYLGGSCVDSGNGIAVDSDGNAYVTGYTCSADFPISTSLSTVPPFRSGGQYAFVTKLKATGQALAYSLYLGGTLGGQGYAIAVDAAGNAYVAGRTGSRDFPITAGAFQATFGGGNVDGYVVKIADDTASNANRFEENAATYAGSWSTYGMETGTFSGGSITATNQAGATATFRFTGTTIAWIGAKCSECGIATVSIDGGTPVSVNTFSPAGIGSVVSESVFSTSGLAPGVTHTLTITITGTSAPGSSGTYIAVDAFDVMPMRLEQSAAAYTGSWPGYGPESGTFSGGNVVASNQAAATATFSFTGTAVSWLGVKCNVCGIATVAIDGGAPVTVNTYGPGAPGSLAWDSVYHASGLAPGVTHTLQITVNGSADAASGGSYIAVDAFDVTR